MLKISIIFSIISLSILEIDLSQERNFNFRPAIVVRRDPLSEKTKMVSDMATRLWNKKNPYLASYYKTTSIQNVTEQLDTSGLYNFYINFAKTSCSKANIKNWDLLESETQNCITELYHTISCPLRVLYKPWSQGYPVKLIKPTEEKTDANRVCFLPEY